MSLIQKKHINYLTHVEQFFIALKGSGLTLSAQDYHLVEQWEQRGVPLDRLCRAIEASVEQLRKQSRDDIKRLSLNWLQDYVEAELESPELRPTLST